MHLQAKINDALPKFILLQYILNTEAKSQENSLPCKVRLFNKIKHMLNM